MPHGAALPPSEPPSGCQTPRSSHEWGPSVQADLMPGPWDFVQRPPLTSGLLEAVRRTVLIHWQPLVAVSCLNTPTKQEMETELPEDHSRSSACILL